MVSSRGGGAAGGAVGALETASSFPAEDAAPWASGTSWREGTPATPYLPRVTTPGFPQTSCWGPRGPPSRLRRLTLGVPSEPSGSRGESRGSTLPHIPGGSGGGNAKIGGTATTEHESSRMRSSAGAGFSREKPYSREKFKPASWRVLRWPRTKARHHGAAEWKGMKTDQSASSLGTLASVSTISTAGSAKAVETLLIAEMRRFLREELKACTSQRDVEKLCTMAGRITSAGTAEQFGISGRFGLRLREVMKPMRDSTFAPINGRYRLALRKILGRESERRLAELAVMNGMDSPHFFLDGDHTARNTFHSLPSVDATFGVHHKSSFHPLPSGGVLHLKDGIPRNTSRLPALAASPPIYDEDARALAQMIMSKADQLVRDGHISLIELQACSEGTENHRHFGLFFEWLNAKSARQFHTFDVDKDGVIAFKELEAALRCFLKEECGVDVVEHLRKEPAPTSPAQAEVQMGLVEPPIVEKRSTAVTSQSSEKVSAEILVWTKAFQKCQDDGEVHHDWVDKVIELSGLGFPDKSCIEVAYNNITQYPTLKLDEYISFVEEYRTALDHSYKEAFRKQDADDSGAVETAELRSLLQDLGVEPMDHVLNEVIQEVDEDGTGSLNFSEFEQVLEKLKSREGFTKDEVDDFIELFGKHDRDGSGDINTQELIGILTFLGYSCDGRQLENLIREVDVDGSGHISQGEYLTCMRKVRDLEIGKIKAAISKYDADGSGTISLEEIEDILMALGYLSVDMQAVREAAEAAGLVGESHEFNLSELWRVLGVYRQREGFTKEDSEEFDAAFARYDKAKVGEVSVLELGKLLRWLGYPVQYEVQKQLVAKVDLDGSGKISLPELRKLIRMHQANELREVHEAFQMQDELGTGLINLDQCSKAFADLGCKETEAIAILKKELESKAASAKVASDSTTDTAAVGAAAEKGDRTLASVAVFAHAFMLYSRALRKSFRANSGFSPQEVEQLKDAFRRYDADGSGDISNRELIALIESTFPAFAYDPAMRPRLLQLMQEVDADGNGSLDFQDFLSLMVQFQELQNKESSERESRAIAATKFSATEVEEFRELFLISSGNSPTLGFVYVFKMLATICPMGDKNATELNGMLHEVVKREEPEGSSPSVNFPEFILLMHKLLEVDFAGIQEKLKQYGPT